MGYTTKFSGPGFWCDPPIREEHAAYIRQFSKTRHVIYNTSQIEQGPTRSRVNVPNSMQFVLLDDSPDLPCNLRNLPCKDWNATPPGVPSLWCDWTVTDEGTIDWSGMDNFYCYVMWLEWIIINLLKPWGYRVQGTLDFTGERDDDFGKIIVVDNQVTQINGWR